MILEYSLGVPLDSWGFMGIPWDSRFFKKCTRFLKCRAPGLKTFSLNQSQTFDALTSCNSRQLFLFARFIQLPPGIRFVKFQPRGMTIQKKLYEDSKNVGGELLRILRILEDSLGFPGDSLGSMWIIEILGTLEDTKGCMRTLEDSMESRSWESSEFCGTLPQSLAFLEDFPVFFKTNTRRAVNNKNAGNCLAN